MILGCLLVDVFVVVVAVSFNKDGMDIRIGNEKKIAMRVEREYELQFSELNCY